MAPAQAGFVNACLRRFLRERDALVAIMVAVSASDQNLRTAELLAIERAVNHTPVFADYDIDRIASAMKDCGFGPYVYEGLYSGQKIGA